MLWVILSDILYQYNKSKLMYDLFFALLRCSLWNTTFSGPVTFNDFKKVLKLAEEQTVFGYVFDSLKGIQIKDMQDKTPIFEAVGLVEQIIQANNNLEKELVGFVKQLNKHNLEYMVVKGQTIGGLYSKPELRQPGDIDFYSPQYLQIRKIFPEAGIPDMIPEKEFSFENNGVTYELHAQLIDFGCKKNKILWQKLLDLEWKHPFSVDIGKCKVQTLSPTTNAIYVFVHLFFHFIKGGVSLRQLCDWAMVLHHHKDEIDREKLQRILRDLDIQNAYCAFGVILIDNLGLSSDEFPVPIKDKDKKWKSKILNDIFKGGNFGKQNHKARSVLGYKLETVCLVIRNSIRYHRLASSEIRMMIPKLIGINLQLIFHHK